MADPSAPKDDIRVLVDRIKKLEDELRDLRSPSGTQRFQAVENLQEAIAAQAAQITFLQTQTSFVSAATLTSYTGGNTGITWQAFNGAFDVSTVVTTSSSGRLMIQPGAMLTGGGFTALIGVEIVGVLGPTWPGATGLAATDGTMSGSRPFEVFGLAPNTAYTIRTRRGIDGTASGVAIWAYQSLTVTKLL